MVSKEMVIAANRHETRLALLEDDQLVEVYFQRSNEYSLAGSIHKGRVTRVLPGMQSAFVDLGLERDTFLYVSDFLEEHEDIDRITGDEPRPRQERERDRPERRPAQAAVPAEPAGEAARETAAQPDGGVAPAVGAGRPEDRDERDRRGRRSRRRRNRGRGFPESKYASGPVSAEEGEPAAETPHESEPGKASAPEEAPLVLPGESLAKYRGSGPASEAEPALGASTSIGPNGSGSADADSAGEESEFDEPVHYPPENALPDAPAHAAESAPEAEEIHWPREKPEPAFAEEPPVSSEMETASAGPAEPIHAGSGAAAAAAWLDEEDGSEIQAMVLEAVEAELERADAAAEEPDVAPAEPGVDAEVAAAPAPPENGSAEVRERGGRYPHRVSRRMRRRMRGPRGEAQEEQQAGAPQARESQSRSEGARGEERTVARPAAGQPSISELLKEGQEIIVQIAKEPLGQKGARITSHIALPGRYVVYMPTLEHMGVSRKISSDEERLRLKRVLQGRRPGPVGGFITRTAAEGRSDDEIAADMEFLYKLWQDIRNKADRRPAPALLHHDLDIVQRVLRDQLTGTFKAIWIDNEEVYENVVNFVQRFQPALANKVKLYTREAPIFDAFGITAELEKALRPKVWLKSGGYIVINQTEALVAIDVNTGKFVGKSNRLEDTIVKTNTEAIKEIVRQVRLRDLGGIIVIDFIDMDERKNRQKVMQALEDAMRVDRAPYKILQFNDFGLVAITRKRVKQSLERTLCAPCPHCDGAGYIKSVQTVVSEILTEARKMAASVEGKEVMLRVHPDVAKVLKSHQNKYLEELEEVLRRPVMVKGDPLLHHEKFDLA
ncbi:MAG TPA: Rne/Rng family ribonuclease [Bryobacteraceae bacterium]|jgi:ribonuclease G